MSGVSIPAQEDLPKDWAHAFVTGDGIVTTSAGAVIPGIPPAPERREVFTAYMLTRRPGELKAGHPNYALQRMDLVSEYGNALHWSPEKMDLEPQPASWHWSAVRFKTVSKHYSFRNAMKKLVAVQTWH